MYAFVGCVSAKVVEIPAKAGGSNGGRLFNPTADGVAVLWSCGPEQLSYEEDRFQHGVFIHYVLSGLAAGVGGLLTAGLIDGGSPTAGDLAELDSIAAVIIGGAAFAGGRGNVGNALVGAFTIGVIRNALNLHNVDPFYQLMAIGVIVLIAVEADVLRGYIEGRVRVAQATRNA